MRYLFQILILFIPLSSLALTRGELVTDSPDFVRIHFSNGWVCTGAFIDRETILTAGHCLDLHSTVTLIENDSELDVKALKLLPNPRYDHSVWHSDDVGLIKTSEYKNFRGDYVLPDRPVESGEGTLLGAGRMGITAEFARLSTTNRFMKLGSILLFTSGEGCVAPNDSGGPIIQGNKIVGIMSTTMVRPCVSTGTAIYPHVDFIRKNLRAKND